MSEQKKFNVGDKVRVAGHPHAEGEGLILSPGGANDPRGWYWTNVDDGRWVGMVHIRNLDPVLEDERRGAPRPKPREGEPVELVLQGRICAREYTTPPFLRLRAEPEYGVFEVGDPRVRQIERRNPGCKACMDRGCNEPGCTARGREARKS